MLYFTSDVKKNNLIVYPMTFETINALDDLHNIDFKKHDIIKVKFKLKYVLLNVIYLLLF